MIGRLSERWFAFRHGAKVRARLGVTRPRSRLLRLNHWANVAWRFFFVTTVLVGLVG